MIPYLNQNQKAYLADCRKIVASAQLAVLGIKNVYDQGGVGVPLLLVSLLLRISSILLGLEILHGEEDP